MDAILSEYTGLLLEETNQVNLSLFQYDESNQIYQKCRKAPAFRHGDIRHTLFPRQLGYHLAVYSE